MLFGNGFRFDFFFTEVDFFYYISPEMLMLVIVGFGMSISLHYYGLVPYYKEVKSFKVDIKRNSVVFAFCESLIITSVAVPVFFYLTFMMEFYRKSSTLTKGMIALFIHPLIFDTFLMVVKVASGKGKSATVGNIFELHPFFHVLIFFNLDTTNHLFRRFLFLNAGSPELSTLFVILSGIQEVMGRSTLDKRNVFMRKLLGNKPMSEEEAANKSLFWNYVVTSNSISEVSSIVISAVMTIYF